MSALRLGGALWLFWLRTGRAVEGDRWLGHALAASEDASPSARCKAMVLWGTLARDTGASGVKLAALNTLGALFWDRGEVERAAAAWREALALAWAEGEPWLAVDPLFGLAAVAAERGAMREALRFLGAADACSAVTGSISLIARVITARIDIAAAANLSPDAIVAERAAGAATPLATVVAEALFEPVDGDGLRIGTNALTRREREVLRLLADGRSDPEIAAALFIGRRTVATHVANLFQKLGVHSRAAASAFAVREGIA